VHEAEQELVGAGEEECAEHVPVVFNGGPIVEPGGGYLEEGDQASGVLGGAYNNVPDEEDDADSWRKAKTGD
jgi:hypothetical protein